MARKLVEGVFVTLLLCVLAFFFYQDLIPSLHASKVLLSLTYDEKLCDKEHPLRLEVMNGSSSPVNRIKFIVSAKMEGHSADLVSTLDSYEYTKIVTPSTTVYSCWAIPPLKSNRNYGEDIDLNKLNWGIRSKVIDMGW